MFIARGGILMYVLLLASIITIAVIIERFIVIFKAKKRDEEFANELETIDNISGIEDYIKSSIIESPLPNTLKRGIEFLSYGEKDATEEMENKAKVEIKSLENHIGVLSTLSAVAPLIGFLGTASGMVKVFMNIGLAKGGVDISMLANGIWEAMLTTIGGLVVGIVALIFNNYFVSSIESMAGKIEEIGHHVILKHRESNRN
ncbi:MotA/TolQ/ExbB proton channel family protein [bacterium]|nr:MotA/TolQ/ExbB proton channel family protein [bacterium]